MCCRGSRPPPKYLKGYYTYSRSFPLVFDCLAVIFPRKRSNALKRKSRQQRNYKEKVRAKKEPPEKDGKKPAEKMGTQRCRACCLDGFEPQSKPASPESSGTPSQIINVLPFLMICYNIRKILVILCTILSNCFSMVAWIFFVKFQKGFIVYFFR